MKEFRAESKKILDMMINSIYSQKEVFLRELISNCSDAMDKLYYKSMTENIGLTRGDFRIKIAIDKQARTLTIEDNGIGMTEQELEQNLGVIAHSGSFDFKKDKKEEAEVDIIGQFGVGFYSSFMVASTVKVLTKAYGADTAYVWESNGADGYTVTQAHKDTHGTVITLQIKESSEQESYDEYLDSYRVEAIIKKYSDYIRYPIVMDKEEHKKKEGTEDEFETSTVEKTVNSMVPVWKKRKSDVPQEEYETFYQDKFMDYEKPLRIIASNIEGAVSYQSLMFIPSHAPYNYYSKEYEKGLQLYASGVMITERCAELLPDCFSFVKGLVDSQDLSLNVSREMLQHDRGLKVIATNLEKKIKSELADMLSNAREDYEKFYKAFGMQLKFGLYNNFGAKKELLKDLLLFRSLNEDKLITLEEYAASMKEGQKYIYYACGASAEAIAHLPQIEAVREAGFDVLCLTDDVDEFVLRTLDKVADKEFKNVASGDLGLEVKEEDKKTQEESKDLLAFVKETLKDKVHDVRLSTRLKNYPVCLSSDGALSIEMEKVLNSMPTGEKVKADKVLEINAAHGVFETMKNWFETDRDRLADLAKVLLSQAQLIEGLPVENPSEYADLVCKLIR